MAKLADAPDLGSGSERSEGSSPFIRTTLNAFYPKIGFKAPSFYDGFPKTCAIVTSTIKSIVISRKACFEQARCLFHNNCWNIAQSPRSLISNLVASELLAEIWRRQCRVPTQNNIVGTRHCRLLYNPGILAKIRMILCKQKVPIKQTPII